jgi:hypothetical protein
MADERPKKQDDKDVVHPPKPPKKDHNEDRDTRPGPHKTA